MSTRLVYLREDDLSWLFNHFPDSCKESSISWEVILLHFLESFSLILWSSFIKSGSFLFIILYLLRRTEVNLREAMFLINYIYLSSGFVFDNVFKIPTNKDRDIMNYTAGYMKRVWKIFCRDYFVFNVTRCQIFDFFSNGKNFHGIFIY